MRSIALAALVGGAPMTLTDCADGGGGAPMACEIDLLIEEALDYNVVSMLDFRAGHSDVEGRIAVGDTLDLEHYSVGLGDPSVTVAVVGGDAWMAHGSLHGDLVVQGDAWLTSVGFPTGGVARRGHPVDFERLEDDLHRATDLIHDLLANGSTSSSWGTTTLRGTDARRNVFRVHADTLATTGLLVLDAPASSTVVIDVVGRSVRLESCGFDLGGHPASKILFNASGAVSLRMAAIGLPGSVLAPSASVDFDDGHMDGTLMVSSFDGDSLGDGQPDGQLNHVPFSARICL
jgi:choice-of-anchor A domain-containing protein